MTTITELLYYGIMFASAFILAVFVAVVITPEMLDDILTDWSQKK